MDLPPVPYQEGQYGEAAEGRFGYIATSEVTALEHEVRDDAVELGAFVAKALGTVAELGEVLGRLGDYVMVEFEVDATALSYGVVSWQCTFARDGLRTLHRAGGAAILLNLGTLPGNVKEGGAHDDGRLVERSSVECLLDGRKGAYSGL
jgi:hypothetical protein